MEEKNNIHTGHRKRLRDLVEKVGLENLNEIQAMEFTLYYVVPRKDTNAIAHDLIKKFGSFSKVMVAPEKELVKVKNIGYESARMLSQMKNIYTYFCFSKNKDTKIIKTLYDLACYFRNILNHKEKEECYAIALNSKDEIVALKCLAKGGQNLVSIEKMELADFALTNKASKIAIAHNHPTRNCMPSQSDDECTTTMKKWLNAIGVEMLDHIIIGNDGIFSFREIKVLPFGEIENNI